MKVYKIFATVLVLSYFGLLAHLYFNSNSDKAFPNKPISIIVHSKPGSAIDLMSRKVAEIAKKYSKMPFVVENHPGTQGIVAMQYVIDRKPDGYSLLGVTKSFISTLIVNKSSVSISDFFFIANMISDPEAIITNKENSFKSIEDVIKQANELNGKQVWIGPGTGSRDHLMAMKTWDVLNINAQWIDYKSGPQAILAMMRGEAPIYIGNPGDIAGKPNLELIAIAANERHKQLPNTPTLKESGFDIVESMWRGYAIKKGTPEKAIKYLSTVLKKVSQDPDWKAYCKDVYSFADYIGPEEFSKNVKIESKETVSYLKKAGLLNSYVKKGIIPLWGVGILLALLVLILILGINKFDLQKLNYNNLLSGAFIWIALFFFYQTTLFDIPEDLNITSPALIPRIFTISLIVFSIWNIINETKGKNKPFKQGNLLLIGKILLALLIYFLAIPQIGYFLSTPIFLISSMYILHYKKRSMMIINAFGFVLFSYVVFQLFLNIELPLGKLFF